MPQNGGFHVGASDESVCCFHYTYSLELGFRFFEELQFELEQQDIFYLILVDVSCNFLCYALVLLPLVVISTSILFFTQPQKHIHILIDGAREDKFLILAISKFQLLGDFVSHRHLNITE